ncbi:MAG TPA: tetratricopeptide repeat protein [Stenomitos sp.]
MVRHWLLASMLALSTASAAVATGEDPVAVAVVQQRQHHFKEAEQTLNSVLEMDPDDLGANLRMGDLKVYCGDEKAAAAYIKRAAAAHPKDLEAQVMLVHAYLWLERLEEAEHQANKTIAAWEGKNPDKVLWARLLVALGAVQGLKVKKEGLVAALRYGMGIRGIFEQACAADPEGALPLYALGRYYLEAPAVAGGDSRKGLELVRKAIRRDPESHVARAFYIQYLLQIGKKDEAREELAAYQRQFGDVPRALAAIKQASAKLP